jgi:hypothetical protein
MAGTTFESGNDAFGCICVRGSEGIFIDDAASVTCRQNPTRKWQLIWDASELARYKQRIATPKNIAALMFRGSLFLAT